MLSDNGTYGHKETCSNCSHLNVFQIPKGIPIANYLTGKLCDNCGCKVKNTGSLNPYHARVGGGVAKDPNIRYVMGVTKSPIGESRGTLQ